MKVTRKTADDSAQAPQYGKWMRLAIWYKNNRILKHVDPFFFLLFFIAITAAIITPKGNCTCEDQIPDQQLSTMAKDGNKEVAAHLAARDNALLCESRRQEILKELERKKHLE